MKGLLSGGTGPGGGKSAAMDSLIGRHTEILGDVRFSGGLHVDGRIKGTVSVPAAGAQDGTATLSVSESGAIEGDIRVPNVILNGLVLGDVYASERLVLNARARVTGNVHYKILQMEPGATINGQLVHDSGMPAVSARGESAVLDLKDARRNKAG